jgi:nucleotide-binding universal stress UspA family protein
MVHLELRRSNAGLLQVVGALAERFNAGVIGIAAGKPMQVAYNEGYVPQDLIEKDREEIEKELKEAEADFRRALQTHVGTVEWRSTVTYAPLADYLARETRSADLIITGVGSGGMFDGSRRVYTGDLIMQLGRPVLIVPAAVDKLKLERVIVGWKDTRETRRAVFDALPLLKMGADVTVVEIAGEEELAAARTRIEDVVGWLKRHGVTAKCLALLSTDDDAFRLNAVAQEQDADVIVAGAYGHSRVREWMLGGVTRDLLLRSDRCAFLSH